MLVSQYHWVHIPTRTHGVDEFNDSHAEGVGQIGGLPEDEALTLVNRWNAQQSGVWQYYIPQ